MKFEKKTEPKHTYYEEIKPGTLFRILNGEDIYIKTDDADTAVHLETGMLDGFFKDDEIIVVDGTLVWEDK